MKTLRLYFIFILVSLAILYSSGAHSKEIKVGLTTSTERIRIGTSKKAKLINLFNNNIISNINEKEAYTVHSSNGLISITHVPSNTCLGAFTGSVQLTTEDKSGFVFCHQKWYRGGLIIQAGPSKNQITIINNVDLEDYLLSVVPSEIPNKWNMEALKSQSIAARSYALGYLGRWKEKGYDLEASIVDQVYQGILSEKERTSQAVKETRGFTLVDKFNKPIIALYHSSGGGYTDSIENLWDMKGTNYIKPKPDYDDDSPHFKWHRKYELKEITNKLSHLNVGNVLNIAPLSRSISQRVMWLEIIGENKKIKLRGEEFRRLINLPSSKFNILIENNYVYFAGRGFGHGLGLSQWGAKALSEAGFTHEEILAHYYPGARLIYLDKGGTQAKNVRGGIF